MPKSDTPDKGRRNVPFQVTMPPEELDRLRAFAAKVGRPVSWAVRDAVTAYLDAVEADAGRLARLQAKVQAAKVDPEAAGETEPLKRGRPRKRLRADAPDLEHLLAELPNAEGMTDAELQAVLDELAKKG
jgi:predicted DNA-binding protein